MLTNTIKYSINMLSINYLISYLLNNISIFIKEKDKTLLKIKSLLL